MSSMAENFAAVTLLRNQLLQPRRSVVNVIVRSNDICIGVLNQRRDDLRVGAQVVPTLYYQAVVLKRQDLICQPAFILSRYPKNHLVGCH
jgi:hypothetical protein